MNPLVSRVTVARKSVAVLETLQESHWAILWEWTLGTVKPLRCWKWQTCEICLTTEELQPPLNTLSWTSSLPKEDVNFHRLQNVLGAFCCCNKHHGQERLLETSLFLLTLPEEESLIEREAWQQATNGSWEIIPQTTRRKQTEQTGSGVGYILQKPAFSYVLLPTSFRIPSSTLWSVKWSAVHRSTGCQPWSAAAPQPRHGGAKTSWLVIPELWAKMYSPSPKLALDILSWSQKADQHKWGEGGSVT